MYHCEVDYVVCSFRPSLVHCLSMCITVTFTMLFVHSARLGFLVSPCVSPWSLLCCLFILPVSGSLSLHVYHREVYYVVCSFRPSRVPCLSMCITVKFTMLFVHFARLWFLVECLSMCITVKFTMLVVNSARLGFLVSPCVSP